MIHLRSVRQKLFVGVLLTSVAALLVTGISLLIFDLRTHKERWVHDITTQAELIGHATGAALQFEDRKFAEDNLGLLRARPLIRAAALYTAKGALFAKYQRPDAKDTTIAQLPEPGGVAIVGDRIMLYHRVISGNEIVGTVYLEGDYGFTNRVTTFLAIAFLVTLAALLVSLLLSQWLQSAVTRPILEIASTARQVGESRDYSVRAKRTTDDEIGALANSFNEMLDVIQLRNAALEDSKRELERQIAERAAADEKLRSSEERYRSLVTASSQMVWTSDAAGKVHGSMPAWQAFTGQAAEEVEGEGWLDALHPDDIARAKVVIRHAVENATPHELEFRVRRQDGVFRYFSIRGVPVLREDGSVREWVGTCTDIHDKRMAADEIQRLNEELEHRVADRTARLEETNRELEAFSYSVSHDLRAPLRAIDGFSHALQEDCSQELNEEGLRYLHRIRSATSRMGQLIEDLLRLARISRTPIVRREVDVSSLVKHVIGELQHRDPDRKVDVVIWEDVMAMGDPRMLAIVLENLLGNAWKFSGKVSEPRIEFGVLRDGDSTTYFVRDNGAGFDMAHGGLLFSAFQRLHAVNEFPGTGVGLATVQRIIHQHGGRIWAHAQPGKGATFYFTLGSGDLTAAKTAEARQAESA